MMVGLLITFWATPWMTAGHLFFAVAATGYIAVGLRFEERDLHRQLGEMYGEYAGRVPALIPRPAGPARPQPGEARHEHWGEGRMQAGAFKDNIVLPYQGIRGDELSEAQRSVMMTTLGVYLGWGRPDHAAVRAEQVAAHLDGTWFSWLGGTSDGEPFYYRIHSPVVLVEFDQQPGVAFDNLEPSHHHIHTIVRTPNGGDYGTDLLAQHHARFDHSRGDHAAT
jgi:hypothetical protein